MAHTQTNMAAGRQMVLLKNSVLYVGIFIYLFIFYK